MTLYDSSLLIDYLDGDEDAVAYIAGTAYTLGERLAVTDADFDVDGLGEVLTVDPV